MAMIHKTLKEMKLSKSRTDWTRVNKMIKDGIEIETDGDFDTSKGKLVHIGAIAGRPALPPEKKKVGTYIRFSPHVLAKLRASGKNWQTRLSKKVEELVAAGVL